MPNRMSLVHHARRLLAERARGNRHVTDRTLAAHLRAMETAYLEPVPEHVANTRRVEMDRVEMVLDRSCRFTWCEGDIEWLTQEQLQELVESGELESIKANRSC
jgi:hypothetical protein